MLFRQVHEFLESVLPSTPRAYDAMIVKECFDARFKTLARISNSGNVTAASPLFDLLELVNRNGCVGRKLLQGHLAFIPRICRRVPMTRCESPPIWWN
jgi:hypothetical protein